MIAGEGAWEDWKYEVHIQEGEKVLHRSGLNQTRLSLTKLTAETSYQIKVNSLLRLTINKSKIG